MNLKHIFVGASALCLLGAGLSACSKPGPAAPEPASAPGEAWTLAAKAMPGVVQAERLVELEGGGQLGMRLSCNYRPNAEAIANGFWLKLELELKSAQPLGLDPFSTSGQTAQLADVRSTGETGGMVFTITDQTHYVFENNQTNALNQDNNDPKAVEIGQRFDLPLSDGRKVSIDMRKGDAGYTELMTRCAALMPVKAGS